MHFDVTISFANIVLAYQAENDYLQNLREGNKMSFGGLLKKTL